MDEPVRVDAREEGEGEENEACYGNEDLGWPVDPVGPSISMGLAMALQPGHALDEGDMGYKGGDAEEEEEPAVVHQKGDPEACGVIAGVASRSGSRRGGGGGGGEHKE